MVDELVTAYGNRFVVAALGVALAMGCLILVLWILKRRNPSPFIRGARSRQPRLQVLDATAIDTRRRLVLVRRDNVEHLIMIGGPTDLVIESRIGENDGYSATDITEEPQRLPTEPVRQAVAPPPRAAIAKAEPARPTPAPRRQAAPVAQPAPAPQQHFDLQDEAEPDNSFFYDEFADDDVSEEEDIADFLEASRERVFVERETAPPAPAAPATPQPQPRAAPRPAAPAQTQAFSPSEFQRVLDEEIALQLTAEAPARPVSRPPPATPPMRPTIAPPRPMAPPLVGRAAERAPLETSPTPALRPQDERRPAAPAASARPLPPMPARPAAPSAPRPAPTPRPAAPARPGNQPNLQNEIARIFGEMSNKREK